MAQKALFPKVNFYLISHVFKSNYLLKVINLSTVNQKNNFIDFEIK